MKVAAFLTIGTASSLAAPSAAKAAAPPKTSMAARAEISDFLDQMFTFYLRADQLGGWSHDRTRQNCHKRANHPLKCLWEGIGTCVPASPFSLEGERCEPRRMEARRSSFETATLRPPRGGTQCSPR